MTDEQTKRPRWVVVADAVTEVLAIAAALVFLTGGGRWKIGGLVIRITSPGRLAAAAVLVAIVRRVAWRPDRIVSGCVSRIRAVQASFRRATAHPWTLGLLGACVLFYLVNNTVWLVNDASSASFDKGAHTRFALQFLRQFQDPAHLSFGKLLGVTRSWPPFFHLCSVPFTMALGFSVGRVAATNFLFLFVAVFSLYRVGARLFDDAVGIGAVALTLLYPMVYALSRVVLVDFALVAMVMLSLQCILASDGGLNLRRSAVLGAVLGCAMLTKWTAVVFVAGPAIVWLVVCLRRDRPSARAAAGSLAMVALVAGIVALPWYVHSLPTFLKGATIAFGSDPTQEGDPTRVIDSLWWYWGAVRDTLILKPLLLPTIVGLGVFAIRVRSWAGWSFLLASVVPAMVFFVLIPNKDPRFLAPLLPIVAIMAAAGIRSMPWKAARAIAWAFVLCAGIWQFYAISFAWPVTILHGYTHAPDRRDWKVHDILTAISAIPTSRPLRVAVLPDDPDFEQNLFQLDAMVRSLPLQIDGFGNRSAPVRTLMPYDVLVSKTGAIGVWYTATPRVEFLARLNEWIKQGNRVPEVTLWRTWPLPDGSRAEAYLIH